MKLSEQTVDKDQHFESDLIPIFAHDFTDCLEVLWLELDYKIPEMFKSLDHELWLAIYNLVVTTSRKLLEGQVFGNVIPEDQYWLKDGFSWFDRDSYKEEDLWEVLEWLKYWRCPPSGINYFLNTMRHMAGSEEEVAAVQACESIIDLAYLRIAEKRKEKTVMRAEEKVDEIVSDAMESIRQRSEQSALVWPTPAKDDTEEGTEYLSMRVEQKEPGNKMLDIFFDAVEDPNPAEDVFHYIEPNDGRRVNVAIVNDRVDGVNRQDAGIATITGSGTAESPYVIPAEYLPQEAKAELARKFQYKEALESLRQSEVVSDSTLELIQTNLYNANLISDPPQSRLNLRVVKGEEGGTTYLEVVGKIAGETGDFEDVVLCTLMNYPAGDVPNLSMVNSLLMLAAQIDSLAVGFQSNHLEYPPGFKPSVGEELQCADVIAPKDNVAIPGEEERFWFDHEGYAEEISQDLNHWTGEQSEQPWLGDSDHSAFRQQVAG